MAELPSIDRLHWIVQTAGKLTAGGAEPVSGLVLPTGKFFPDDFSATPKGLRTLLKRVAKLAGLSDLKLRLNLLTPEGESLGGGGCSTGGCGTGPIGPMQLPRVQNNDDDSYTLNVNVAETGNPIQLTTVLIRCLSAIFLREAGLVSSLGRDEAEAATDLAGVLMGFGVILSNGSYMSSKG